eukprot:2772017-Ditylum_brightwellii.AAC.1
MLTAKKEEREKPSVDSEALVRQRGSSAENLVVGALKRGSTICSIKAEGLSVTCVPGGATRLTESPIIKFVLLDVNFGMALCPAPADGKILAEAALEKIAEKNAVMTGLREMHA